MDEFIDENDALLDSDEDVDIKQHSKLLENLVSLDSKQPVKKPTRTEPTTQISEYNLVKSITGNKDTVKLYELTKPLKARATHVKITKDVKKSDKKTKTLEKPLEKPQAEKVRRTVGYEKGKEEISRWEPVVTSHRASTYLSFPLNYDTKVEINSKRDTNWKVKSDLEKAIENIENEGKKVEIYEIEPEIEAPLTLQEMMERRKEMAKLRRFQTYQEMKARMQNKIKSKKYRRILRKERAKQEIKDFEKLQKENPEEALKKLEEIEKTRMMERASLRHKSTGKWAKNQQIRAKFDKDSRQVLAEQLAISKELTQKKQIVESSESEVENDDEKSGDLEFNFWLTKKIPEKNENEEKTPLLKSKIVEIKDEIEKPQKKRKLKINKDVKNKVVKKPKEEKLKLHGMSGDWVDESFVDDLANKLEDKFKEKVLKKSTKLKNDLEKLNLTHNLKKKKIGPKKENKPNLTLKKSTKKPIIDEPLQEATKITNNPSNNNINNLKSILDSTEVSTNTIEPNKYLKLTPTNVESSNPDLYSTNDNENNSDLRGIIAEAFEDEDLIEEFSKDKQEEIDKDTPNDLDLFMPGWGSWGGTNIKSTSKRKRFIMKFPKDLPRNDKNRGDLIINENTSKNIKPHMVSDVPFPFKSANEYEATIKAPVGNTFVPETAFRRLTKPGVTTKLGTVIEPVDENVLMRKMKKFEKVFKLKK
nr:U3 small nucleolar RNA-associated protein 14 homolog A [Onthophagus taurus]